MSHQLTFADSEFSNKRRKTRKEIFLSRMDGLLPWPQLLEVVEPYYPKAGNGRRPYPLETMLRIHCMQQWYALSDEAMEDALYEIASMRLFAHLSLDSAIPDRTTIMNFRHLLEKHQTKKGNLWFYGMKAHIGVDAKSGMIHTFKTTSSNEHDLNQLSHLLHGEEEFVSADAGYRGAEKREELKGTDVDWLIAERPSKVNALKKQPRKNKRAIRIEFLKASIRAKVEHPFRIIKCQFKFVKDRYKGLAKNDNQLAMLFTLANIVRLDQMIRWQPKSA